MYSIIQHFYNLCLTRNPRFSYRQNKIATPLPENHAKSAAVTVFDLFCIAPRNVMIDKNAKKYST